MSLSSFEPWTDYPRHRSLLPAYFPDPAAASRRRRPTPRRPSPAPQSQVNTAASARRCVYQLSCLVPPSKLPNRRQRQPAAIFLRPAAAPPALLLVREGLLLQWASAGHIGILFHISFSEHCLLVILVVCLDECQMIALLECLALLHAAFRRRRAYARRRPPSPAPSPS